MGGRLISARHTDEVTVVQGKAIPETALLKGVKSFELRRGTVSHIFYETEWNDPFGITRRTR